MGQKNKTLGEWGGGQGAFSVGYAEDIRRGF